MGETVTVDYLVVGSGIAGLWFAYRASRHGTVLIATKKQDTESNTNYAQGGIAAAFAADDSPELHLADTIAAGAGLADPTVARIVTEAGPGLIRELHEVGVDFTAYRDAHGHSHFDLGQEGGHHRRRIVHSQDSTGLAVEKGLLSVVRQQANIQVAEQQFAVDLAIDRTGRCVGAYFIDPSGRALRLVRAARTLLATGGIGQVYSHSTNPPIATGDGIAMGLRAGAVIANMEFIQFHPTALHGRSAEGRVFLISEALRGEGAVLKGQDNRTFMERYHPDASLAPRDVVARAIDTEMRNRGEDHVLLDATQLDPDRVRRRFPNIYRVCFGLGIDITHQPIPVVPAAHYVCGGLQVNSWGETSVPGLLAAGECACSGLHGANRLASNSLLEALVLSDRAAGGIAAQFSADPGGIVTDRALPTRASTDADEDRANELRRSIQTHMWCHAGIMRSDAGLARARRVLRGLGRDLMPMVDSLAPTVIETRNLWMTALLVVVCASSRRESRGLHFNTDHPEIDPASATDTAIVAADVAEFSG